MPQSPKSGLFITWHFYMDHPQIVLFIFVKTFERSTSHEGEVQAFPGLVESQGSITEQATCR